MNIQIQNFFVLSTSLANVVGWCIAGVQWGCKYSVVKPPQAPFLAYRTAGIIGIKENIWRFRKRRGIELV